LGSTFTSCFGTSGFISSGSFFSTVMILALFLEASVFLEMSFLLSINLSKTETTSTSEFSPVTA
jgi:hypothetical protein